MAVKRRTIDDVLIGIGLVALAVLASAAGLLTWGNRFVSDYVGKELSLQRASLFQGETRRGLLLSAGLPRQRHRRWNRRTIRAPAGWVT